MTSTNPAIRILFTLTLVFYLAAVALSILHMAEPIIDHAWGAFEGAIGALLLILKADNSHSAPPLAPPVDPDPTKK